MRAKNGHKRRVKKRLVAVETPREAPALRVNAEADARPRPKQRSTPLFADFATSLFEQPER